MSGAHFRTFCPHMLSSQGSVVQVPATVTPMPTTALPTSVAAGNSSAGTGATRNSKNFRFGPNFGVTSSVQYDMTR